MTQPVLAFVHTIPANIETFDALVGELAPDIPVRHALHGELLKEALDAGELTADIRRRTAEAVVKEAEKGAAVVLCTCSTVGPGADDAAGLTATKVMRIDRPMAEAAVRTGARIGVARDYAGFDDRVDKLLEDAGLTARFIEQEQYTVFTLETHLMYLAEAHQAWGEALGWLRGDHWQRYLFDPEAELADLESRLGKAG